MLITREEEKCGVYKIFMEAQRISRLRPFTGSIPNYIHTQERKIILYFYMCLGAHQGVRIKNKRTTRY